MKMKANVMRDYDSLSICFYILASLSHGRRRQGASRQDGVLRPIADVRRSLSQMVRESKFRIQ